MHGAGMPGGEHSRKSELMDQQELQRKAPPSGVQPFLMHVHVLAAPTGDGGTAHIRHVGTACKGLAGPCSDPQPADACLQVKAVPEDSESADALRAVARDITAANFVVMSVDLITNVKLEVGSTLGPLSLAGQCDCKFFYMPLCLGGCPMCSNALIKKGCCGQALLAVHFVREAAATVLLSRRKTSPASETKPGKAPRNVDYIGGVPVRCAPRSGMAR